ncbi:ATP-dependent helicase [Clostridium sp. A1-XYC3]|uniref:DNA 3'-5' helicase n=1 Tax=Clostridium tanneri TaxID=3037988 RepID=A0ABU4JYG8_9CLOT|nr:ATP-dependent helicase [Clostridium sp. A1-XYC3]MDW8802941.1 ATP-dependent helicase [Clostridium sp. A1-XYC3]
MIGNNNLDSYQKRAVFAEDKNVLVVAPPGSGKTTVIISRIVHLIVNKRVSVDNMIVITFTRAAALNMKERFLKLTKASRSPFFGTFHALFYKILSRHKGDINIIKTSEVYKLVNGVLISFLDSVSDEKVKEVINDISLFKNSQVDINDFKSKIDKAIFRECFTAYENYKEENRLMDFDDLQLNTKKLFLEKPELLDGYRSLFKYILVDEFQDCDKLQVELLQMLGVENSIFAVGDEDQCIYGFRGSRPDCMVEFDRYFKDGQKIFLRINYRSSENIVSLSKKLIQNNKNRNNKEIEASKSERGNIKIYNVENEKSQSERIIESIEGLIKENNYTYKDMAILYRTNMESRSIIEALLKKDIPLMLMDKEYDFFEHFVCKDIIAFLKLSIDSTDRESFVRIINKPFRYISKVNIEKVRKSIIKDNCLEILRNIEDMPIFQIKNIETLERDILRLNKMNLKDAINFIINNLGYLDYIREYSQRVKADTSELKDVLEEFKEAAEDYNSITNFLLHIDTLKDQLKKKSKDTNGVVLSTIHGVKGMEFTNVFIINCDEEVIPHINSIPQNLEEERRLFYVAITRAIHNIYMYTTKTLKGRGRSLSRFIKEFDIGVEELHKKEAAVNIPYQLGEDIVHKTYGSGKISKIEGKYISIIFSNGIERKFDALVVIDSGLLHKY